MQILLVYLARALARVSARARVTHAPQNVPRISCIDAASRRAESSLQNYQVDVIALARGELISARASAVVV